MASVLLFTLTVNKDVTKNVKDAAGEWEYVGATGSDNSGKSVKLLATKRLAHAPSFKLSASMLAVSIQFDGNAPGVPASNLTLQGVHDLVSGAESGSVSAASADLADYIGATFTFDGKSLLTIQPRAAGGTAD